jgi:hypothetical protein
VPRSMPISGRPAADHDPVAMMHKICSTLLTLHVMCDARLIVCVYCCSLNQRTNVDLTSSLQNQAHSTTKPVAVFEAGALARSPTAVQCSNSVGIPNGSPRTAVATKEAMTICKGSRAG